MGDLYYIGDTINLGFRMVVDETTEVRLQPIKLTSITVSVFSEEGKIIHEDPVTVVYPTSASTEGVVKYEIDPAMTKHAGDYSALFEMTFTGGQIKTFEMPFVILPRGISKEGAGTHVGKLTEESTEDEVEKAVADDLRNMRQDGKDQMESYKFVLQIAQYKTGKYHRRW